MKSARTKAKRNPVPTIDDVCEICEKPYASLHEVFFGTANRQKSIQHGMQMRLCLYHHEIAQSDKATIEANHILYQARFEERAMSQGMTEEEARAYFMREFGRNYL